MNSQEFDIKNMPEEIHQLIVDSKNNQINELKKKIKKIENEIIQLENMPLKEVISKYGILVKTVPTYIAGKMAKANCSKISFDILQNQWKYNDLVGYPNKFENGILDVISILTDDSNTNLL